MKSKMNSLITYCKTAAISQRAAEVYQGKTHRDRATTKKDRRKRKSGLEAEMGENRGGEGRVECGDWLPLIFTISGADKRQAPLCSDTNCPWKVTRSEAEALCSDRRRRATSALIARDIRQPSSHTGHRSHQPEPIRRRIEGEGDWKWGRLGLEGGVNTGKGSERIN